VGDCRRNRLRCDENGDGLGIVRDESLQ